ncbi:hypothetical protein [Paludisphaera borealis]|uniref:Uncharacterized protein n=1 Tax=Paludisphaera borealis TaxID=1387353 RepID=A0A1U7CWG4_9BACT|nr:hypothetical protein [Paludisphaera borealis]APW63246.1 hypothetical protein BSF38_04810 [Paludisphaera borealis]MDR3619226.1 hypothetical protein [Paludisphaera borealis]
MPIMIPPPTPRAGSAPGLTLKAALSRFPESTTQCPHCTDSQQRCVAFFSHRRWRWHNESGKPCRYLFSPPVDPANTLACAWCGVSGPAESFDATTEAWREVRRTARTAAEIRAARDAALGGDDPFAGLFDDADDEADWGPTDAGEADDEAGTTTDVPMAERIYVIPHSPGCTIRLVG